MKPLPFIVLLVVSATLGFPQVPPPTEEEGISVDEFVAGLTFQNGTIELADGVATLDVPDTFTYLGAEDAQSVLEDYWGNPPDDTVLGMLFPAEIPLTADESWGVVITYEEDGYVEDGDAADLDYDELLTTMQSDIAENNEARRELGYGEMELVDWAAPPRYDPETNKLYWAKNLRFEGTTSNILNYNIRVLGRRGVLVLNAVAAMDQLAPVEGRMDDVMAFVNFNEGNRYIDFDPDMDDVAAYGIGALVAGKLAAKVGILKGLAIFAAKFWKLIAIAFVGVGAFLKKMFLGKLGEGEAS